MFLISVFTSVVLRILPLLLPFLAVTNVADTLASNAIVADIHFVAVMVVEVRIVVTTTV